MSAQDVVFLNPRTCGIYKNGAPRYKTDSYSGRRTEQIDNQLIEAVDAYLKGENVSGEARVSLEAIFAKQVLVPTYYDQRYNEGIRRLLDTRSISGVTIGALLDDGILGVRAGHGSPSNDQRTGHIPYVKVSDIRGLRINVNPTNLVTESVARRFWRGGSSGLQGWDVITPNRASSNIGEFAILLPGEEQIVVTKEVFVLRVLKGQLWDPFYLLWALSLRAVRDQWRRIALMQTNREDCGDRYKEVILPNPPSRSWAQKRSEGFRNYFQSIADAKQKFIESITAGEFEHIASVVSIVPTAEVDDDSVPSE